MGIFNNQYNKSDQAPFVSCVLGGYKAIDLILDRTQGSKGAKFEVLILGSYHMLKEFAEKRICYANQFKEGLISELYTLARKEDIERYLPCEFFDFVNNRLNLCEEQLQSRSERTSGSHILTKLAYNFFENPLKFNSGHSSDLQTVLTLTMKLKHYFEVLDNIIELVIKEYYWDNTPFELYLSGAMKQRDRDKKPAIEEMTKSINLCPEFVSPYFERGKMLTEIKDFDGAIYDFTKVMELTSSRNEEIYDLRGQAFFNKGDFISAIGDFSTHVQLNPYSLSTNIEIGDAKMKLQDFNGAIADYSFLINSYEEDEEEEDQELLINYEVYFKRGEAHMKLKNYIEANDDFTMALKNKYEHQPSRIYYRRAKAKAAMEDYSGAISDYSIILKKHPDNSKTYYYRGKAYGAIKDYDNANRDFSQVIKLDPNNGDGYFSRGSILMKINDLHGADADFKIAIDLNPNNEKFYFQRGMLNLSLKKSSSAFQDFSKTIELNPRNAYAYFNRGYIFMGYKRYSHAINEFKKTIEINPLHPKAQEFLQKALDRFHDQ